MARFKVLDIKPVLCQRIGIIPTSIIAPPYKFFRAFGEYYVLFFCLFSFISSIVYVIENYTDIDNALKTIPMIIGGIQSIGMFTSVGLRSPYIVILREKLQTLVDKADENSDIFNNYWKYEQNCRNFAQRLSRYVHAEQAIYTSVMARSLYLLVTGKFDTSELILSYNLVIPWDTETMWGWYLYYYVSVSIAFVFSSAMIPITSLFVSCSYYITAMCKHIDILGASIDRSVGLRIIEENLFKRVVIDMKIQKTYSEMVNIHVDLFEIFNLIATIFSGAIFALMPPMSIFLAMEMYTMENFRNSMDAVSVGFSIICVFVGTLWSSLFSIHATRVVDQIEGIGETAYSCNWYDLSPTLQRYTVLIIARSQEPINFAGLGMVYCNLETFGKLVNSAISYYLVFRELSNI